MWFCIQACIKVFNCGTIEFYTRQCTLIVAHRNGDELYDRKRPQEVNPLLTHNASLTLRMCALARRQLPAFDFLAHLLFWLFHRSTNFRYSQILTLVFRGLSRSLPPIGFRQSSNTKISCLAKVIIWIDCWHNNHALGNGKFAPLPFLLQYFTLKLLYV